MKQQPWHEHGPLRVAESGHQFRHEDGTPFFWLGDTAWALHQNLARADVEFYLDDAAAAGFTVVQLMSVNYWALRDGRNFYGQTPYVDNNATRLNPPYWEHLGWVIDAAARRGLYVLLVYGCPGRTDEHLPYVETVEQARAYATAVGQGLCGKPNLIWSGGIDVNPDDAQRVSAMGMAGWHAMAEAVHAAAGAPVLMTYHPRGASTSSTWFHDAPWLSFNGAQLGIGKPAGRDQIWKTIAADYVRQPAKPVVNLESWYEGCTWQEPPVNDYEMRLQAYPSLFAGACGFTYGHNVIYWMDSPNRGEPGGWKPHLRAPGRLQMRHVRAAFETAGLHAGVPDLPLITASPADQHRSPHIRQRISATGDAAGRAALVYTPRGEPFQADLSRLRGSAVQAEWFDPRTGARQAAGRFPCAKPQEFQPPGGPGAGHDWVLLLTVA